MILRKLTCFVLALILLVPLGISLIPEKAEAASQAEINQSVEDGVEYLISQQNANGSWGSSQQNATTGFVLAVLSHYADSLDTTPLSPTFAYRSNFQAGLNYLFGTAKLAAADRVYWDEYGGYTNYVTGPVLMGLCRSETPDAVVNVAGSVVNTWTYKQVAQAAVNYLVWTQTDTGVYTGGWGYSGDNSGGDMSATGWVTLGLGYANHGFNIPLPADMLSKLNSFVGYIQYMADPGNCLYGGAGYTQNNYWVNIYKTGHLIYIMQLLGDSLSTTRLQAALSFLERYWEQPTSGAGGGCYDAGWRGNPPGLLPSYIATMTTMKGLVLFGIENIGPYDWYEDFSDVIVANQNAAGWWDQGGFPSGSYYRTLSTCWALLTLLKATSGPPKLPALSAKINSPQDGSTITIGECIEITATIRSNCPETSTDANHQTEAVMPVCIVAANNVKAKISITGNAEIQGAATKNVANSLACPDKSGKCTSKATVSFKVCCTGPGDVTIKITPYGEYICGTGVDGIEQSQTLSDLFIKPAYAQEIEFQYCPLPGENLISDTIVIKQQAKALPQSSSSPSWSPGPEYNMPRESQIVVLAVNAQPQQAVANQEVTIFGNIANRGDIDGNYQAVLKINGKVEATKSGIISGNKATPLEFIVYRDEPGTYQVDLNGQTTYFTVAGSAKNSPLDTRMIFVIVIAVLVLAAIVVLVRHFATR